MGVFCLLYHFHAIPVAGSPSPKREHIGFLALQQLPQNLQFYLPEANLSLLFKNAWNVQTLSANYFLVQIVKWKVKFFGKSLSNNSFSRSHISDKNYFHTLKLWLLRP